MCYLLISKVVVRGGKTWSGGNMSEKEIEHSLDDVLDSDDEDTDEDTDNKK